MSGEPPFRATAGWGLPRRALLLALVLSLAVGWAPLGAAAQALADTVGLTIDYGDGVEKSFPGLPWHDGMTVLDAMEAASAHPRGITFEHRGRGATAFLVAIDGLENEGGGRTSRNWILRVNGDLSRRGFGVYELRPSDIVLWSHAAWPAE